jgi:23S rRNA (guanosine2251-2'-O)-methyltransferase
MSEWRGRSKEFSEQPFTYEYASLHELIVLAEGRENALIIVLDHLTDVGNLGAVVRSAEVVGAIGVLIPKKRSAAVNEAVFRTSAGAINHLRVAREANLVDSLKRLKEQGFWIGGASEHAQQSIWQAPLQGRLAVVMGSEDEGLSRLVKENCDFLFKLPQHGVTQSLNVAQAATAIMYEWLRRVSCASI